MVSIVSGQQAATAGNSKRVKKTKGKSILDQLGLGPTEESKKGSVLFAPLTAQGSDAASIKAEKNRIARDTAAYRAKNRSSSHGPARGGAVATDFNATSPSTPPVVATPRRPNAAVSVPTPKSRPVAKTATAMPSASVNARVGMSQRDAGYTTSRSYGRDPTVGKSSSSKKRKAGVHDTSGLKWFRSKRDS